MAVNFAKVVASHSEFHEAVGKYKVRRRAGLGSGLDFTMVLVVAYIIKRCVECSTYIINTTLCR